MQGHGVCLPLGRFEVIFWEKMLAQVIYLVLKLIDSVCYTHSHWTWEMPVTCQSSVT